MSYYLVSAFSFSIFVPGVLALINLKKIERRYYPFLFCLWVGCLNEVLSFLLITHHHPSTVNNNIYVFIESLLMAWFFKEQKMLSQNNAFATALIVLSLAWCLDNFLVHSIYKNSTYFRIVSSFFIVLMSITLINKLLLGYEQKLYKNALFILCCCFIIYHLYKILIQAFVIYGLSADITFLTHIYYILIYINLAVNILYIFALLCMPRQVNYILAS